MTWTTAFGRACRVLLNAIVRGLALTRISPNVLTFMGLVINVIAAVLFGYANPDNQQRLFVYAGLVIIGAIFNRMAPVLWVIAVLSTITVIHRIRHTYQQTKAMDAARASAA